MFSSFNFTQIEDSRKFSRLDLKLGSVIVNSGLDLNFLGNVDMLFV